MWPGASPAYVVSDGWVPANISAKIGSRGFQDVTLDTRYFVIGALPQHFSMFYTNLKIASISHSLSLWRVHVFISSCCPCPCSISLNVWHKLLDWDSSCVFNWTHFNDLWNIKWPRWGWAGVSVPLSTELLLSFRQWNTNFHQHWPTPGQGGCRAEMFPHFVLLLPPRPGIGLSDHRPPAGGNQVFEEIREYFLLWW